MHAKRSIFIFFLLGCLLSALPACEKETASQGSVASVNGEYINLHSVQALLDSRSAALGIPSSPSVAEMQKRYGNSLAILIVHTLVRQELERKGIAVTEVELDKAIKQIKADYPDGNLEDFLAAAYLREDEWRQLMRDYLALETFTNHILIPSIRIRLDEISAYYKQNAAKFIMPETWRVCFKSADKKEEIDAWCSNLYAGMPPEANMQCMTAVEKEIPDPWRQDIKKIKHLACGKPIQYEGQWRVAAVMAQKSSGARKLSDIYAVIENILLEEKKNAAFEQWLAQKLASADIRVAPEIIRARQAQKED